MSTEYWFGTRQRLDENQQSTGVWDFVCTVDGQMHRVGYCAGWEELSAELIEARYGGFYVKEMLEAQEKRRPYQAKYHNDGHADKHGACVCYHDFLLDHGLLLNRYIRRVSRPHCQVAGCSNHTVGHAEIPTIVRLFDLCSTHLNREGVASLFAAEELCDAPFVSSH